MALRIYAREKGSKTTRKYVAKTVSCYLPRRLRKKKKEKRLTRAQSEEYSLNDAYYQLRRIPSHHTVSMVRDQMDPFMNENRAYEHIKKLCSGLYRVYFPGYHGVIRGVDPEDRRKWEERCGGPHRDRRVRMEIFLPCRREQYLRHRRERHRSLVKVCEGAVDCGVPQRSSKRWK